MIYAIIGGIVVLIILICVIMVLVYKNKYNFLYIKVKEADNNLDILLQKKEEILLKIIPILEEAKIKDIPEVIKLKSKRLNHHELYQELMDMTTEILKIIDDYEDKLDFKKLDALVDKLNENENDLRAALKYYNDNGEEIIYLSHKFPTNLIKTFSHYQDIETYKLEKREAFEILKH
ncbi:MAG TPA: LemA family protein [Candidatus Onthousia excrementipullorum]|uniref:LemA family protein n=1 Tax=Candidatus Onthousia excrementipullorum TaxID=2840884 RepID=A0A9D1J414_9FIRM|nr:LemA family protein [Candidatus Onthousia excrementipullorum]